MPSGNVRTIGLTGSFGSGKSTVLALFKKRGAKVLDSDAIVHKLWKSAGVKKKILQTFGVLNRKELAGIVFNSPVQRKKLENILHPLVGKELRRGLKGPAGKLVVCDVPLLFEKGWGNKFDKTIYVDAPVHKRVSRLRKRGFSSRDVRVRSKAQWPAARKKGKADIVINNSGSLADLKKQIDNLTF